MVKRCCVTVLVKCVPSVMNFLTEHFWMARSKSRGYFFSVRSDMQGNLEDTRRSLRFIDILRAIEGGWANTFFILSDWCSRSMCLWNQEKLLHKSGHQCRVWRDLKSVKCCQFYMVTKVHKLGNPGRPYCFRLRMSYGEDLPFCRFPSTSFRDNSSFIFTRYHPLH